MQIHKHVHTHRNTFPPKNTLSVSVYDKLHNYLTHTKTHRY